MKPILIIPSNTLSAKEKTNLEEAGYIVIITDEPEKVKFITPNKETLMGLDKDKMLAAMMRIFYNIEGDSAIYAREWLLRIFLSEMGAIKDKAKTTT